MYNWHECHKMYIKYVLKGIVNKTMNMKVKMYVIMNSHVSSIAGPLLFTLKSGAILSKKEKQEECDCTHPVR